MLSVLLGIRTIHDGALLLCLEQCLGTSLVWLETELYLYQIFRPTSQLDLTFFRISDASNYSRSRYRYWPHPQVVLVMSLTTPFDDT